MRRNNAKELIANARTALAVMTANANKENAYAPKRKVIRKVKTKLEALKRKMKANAAIIDSR